MILTAHQPVYLPWLGLFHKIALADVFVSLDQVQYATNDWINRNKIKTQSGPVWMTVPVFQGNHFQTPIGDIKIKNTAPWARKHWKSLQQAYAKAPYFKTYADFFEDLYLRRTWTKLIDLNTYMLCWFLDELGIKTKASSANEHDFKGTKSELILDMCLKLGADAHIFGALGRDYVDVAAFERAGVKAVFQNYVHPTYPQQHGAFASHLSIVDLLFNCGSSSFDILMSDNLNRAELLRSLAS